MENVEGQACEEQQNIFNCSDENYFNMSIITVSPENDDIQNNNNNGVSGGTIIRMWDTCLLITQYELLKYIALSDGDSEYL
jgi:hypothetical protein